MERVTQAKQKIMEEDRCINRLPDAVLKDIISLLPTRDGGRTQVISPQWRHLWRSAPLNLDLHDISPLNHDLRDISLQQIPINKVSHILSLHEGPGRRFSIPRCYLDLTNRPAETLDGWLQSSALKNLQELEFRYDFPRHDISLPPPPLPMSVHNFSSTLRVASFGGCGGFPDGNSVNVLQLPVLKQLSLLYVTISDSSMQTLLDGCPVLESLLINCPSGCSCIRVVCHSLRSLGVSTGCGDLRLKQLIIKDAPDLERLLLLTVAIGLEIDISVISAPKLEILGQISDTFPKIQFGTTFFQGSRQLSLMTAVPNVKVLALTNVHLDLDMVVNFMRCFPCLETLYIKIMMSGNTTNAWCHKYRNLISTLDIRLKKIVLLNYRGNRSHINFAKFFVLNAKVLQSMILELQDRNTTSEWIERQRRLIKANNKASTGAQFDFVYHDRLTYPFGYVSTKVTHDLSVDPFVKFREWPLIV